MDTNKPSFFYSRKNLVGMVIAALVVVVHLVVGLGVLWPVVAIASWGAGFALTPGPRQSELAPARQLPDVEDLLDILENEGRALYASSPAHEVIDAMVALKDSLVEILAAWDRLIDAPEQRVVIESIITEYLPAVAKSYRDFSGRSHPKAVAETTESFTILREESERIRQAVLSDTLRELEDQTRALRMQFGRLPDPGYDSEP